MAGTMAFDVKDALEAAMIADANFATLVADSAIWYGDLSFADGRPRELIWIGEIEWDNESAIALGGLRRDEFFRIMITIEVHAPADTQKQANYKARDWMKKIEALVRNPRWSGLPLVESGLEPQMLVEGPDGADGRGAMLILWLVVHARKS